MALRFEGNFNFTELDANMRAARPEASKRALEHVGEVSAQQTPVLEGTLVRSQKVEAYEDGSGGEISYDTSYAVYVHEILRRKHPHGNAKFLEIPLVSEAQTALDIAAKVIGDAL